MERKADPDLVWICTTVLAAQKEGEDGSAVLSCALVFAVVNFIVTVPFLDLLLFLVLHCECPPALGVPDRR